MIRATNLLLHRSVRSNVPMLLPTSSQALPSVELDVAWTDSWIYDNSSVVADALV